MGGGGVGIGVLVGGSLMTGDAVTFKSDDMGGGGVGVGILVGGSLVIEDAVTFEIVIGGRNRVDSGDSD